MAEFGSGYGIGLSRTDESSHRHWFDSSFDVRVFLGPPAENWLVGLWDWYWESVRTWVERRVADM